MLMSIIDIEVNVPNIKVFNMKCPVAPFKVVHEKQPKKYLGRNTYYFVVLS